jgi:SAM-dependent methyltransferase
LSGTTDGGGKLSRSQQIRARHYPEVAYGGFSEADGALRFYSRIRALLRPEDTVLDIGCGRGAKLDDPVVYRRQVQVLRGLCRRVIGIDVDQAGAENSSIDEFRHLPDPTAPWPIETGSIDLALSDYVMEHVPDPAAFLSEARRVLRPGGILCLRTPNAWGYAGVATRLIPNNFHALLLKRLQPERKSEDVFPTLYRCNSTWTLRRALRAQRFEDVVVYGYDPEPAYLTFSDLSYRLGLLIHRLAPSPLRSTLFAFARREAR